MPVIIPICRICEKEREDKAKAAEEALREQYYQEHPEERPEPSPEEELKKKKEEEERNYQASLNEPPQAEDSPTTPLSSSVSSKTPGNSNKEFKFSLEEIEREIKEDTLGSPSHASTMGTSAEPMKTPSSTTHNENDNNESVADDSRLRTVSLEDVVPSLQAINLLTKPVKKVSKKK